MENSYEIPFAVLSRISYKLYSLSAQIADASVFNALDKNLKSLNELCLKIGSNTIFYKGNIYAGSVPSLDCNNLILEPKDEDTLEEIISINKGIEKDKDFFFRVLASYCDDIHISECITECVKRIPRKCSDIDILRNIFPEYCYTVLHDYFLQEHNYRCIEPVIKLPKEFKDKFMYYVGISLL
jgi:hypothetical protein